MKTSKQIIQFSKLYCFPSGETWDWWLAGSEETSLELYICIGLGILTMAAVTLPLSPEPEYLEHVVQWRTSSGSWINEEYCSAKTNFSFCVLCNRQLCGREEILIKYIWCFQRMFKVYVLKANLWLLDDKSLVFSDWCRIVMKSAPTLSSNKDSQGHSGHWLDPTCCPVSSRYLVPGRGRWSDVPPVLVLVLRTGLQTSAGSR